MNSLQAEENIKSIVFKHIDPKSYKIFLFGSRAKGKPRNWSDFDVGVMGESPLPIMAQAEVEDELEASSIPYIVDVVDFHKVDQSFKNLALKDAILWN